MRRVGLFGLAAAFALLASGLLALVAGALSAAQERTVVYAYLDEALDTNRRAVSRVVWQGPIRPLVRDLTPGDAALVGTALTSAWQVYAAATETRRTDILADNFSGVALARASQAAQDGYDFGTRFVMLSQSARPAFYHLDGSVLQIEAEALSVRFAIGQTGLEHFEMTRDQVTTTLMNETTGWRIFAHERQGAIPVSEPARKRPVPDGLAGVNYYPAETPWRAFWPAFDDAVIAADFALIADLGANAVRVFLPSEIFLDPRTQTETLSKLERLLQLAQEHRLWVVPTLFDMKYSYNTSVWAQDMALLETVLPVLAASGAVAYVDLKNEPDLDFETHGRGKVEAWLKTMALLSHEIAPDLPVTVGWSAAEAAHILAQTVDLVSYHDYAPLEGTADRLRAVRAAVPDVPLHITEIGASSFSALGGFPGSATAQAEALDARLAALAGAEGVFVWTLHDFPEPDRQAVGNSPWVLRLQAQFGLIDPQGQTKPAHDVVSERFAVWLARFSEGAKGDR